MSEATGWRDEFARFADTTSGGGSCGATCGICGATCLIKGAHSVHRFNCGHADHDQLTPDQVLEWQRRITDGLQNGPPVWLSPGVEGPFAPIKSDLRVVIGVPLGPGGPAYRMFVRLADDGPMITSIFSIRLEGWPESTAIAVDLLMVQQEDGTPLVLLDDEKISQGRLMQLDVLPRRWFRAQLAELRSA